MKKNIFFCFNPFHCITALIINEMLDESEHSDIVIVDNFEGAYVVASRMKEINKFYNVYYAKDYRKVRRNAFINISPITTLKKLGLSELIDNKYDRLFTNLIAECIGDSLTYINKDIEVELFDEGYSTYMTKYLVSYKDYSIGHKLLEKVSILLFRRKLMRDLVQNVYLYDPRLLSHKIDINIIKIDTKQLDESVVECIKTIFEVCSAMEEYSKPYIFFEECFGNDFGDNRDIELVSLIGDIVGKNNMLIKLHPRDETNRFEKLEYATNKNKEVPWEAIAILSGNMKDNVLITFTSGAALNFHFLNHNKIKTILLYKLDKTGFSRMSKEKEVWFDKFSEYYGEKIFIPNSRDELKSFLLQNRGN